jgi:hypothetical protein
VTDRLGVRTSCEAVVGSSRHVRINDDAVMRLAYDLQGTEATPEWDAGLHYRATGDNAEERTAMWLLVLDALNFCFWSDDPAHRWRVEWRGELVDGYVALVAALTTAVEAGYALHDARWLANVSERDVAAVLAPAEGHTDIPLFHERVANLRELGTGLLPYGANPAAALISSAGGNAITLVQRIVEELPSFSDVTTWPYADTGLPENEVRFYKRAQILVGDLAGGLAGCPLADFADLDQLTAFADYKVPQILRWLGVLVYDDALATTVDTRTRIRDGSRMEIEIRAATIVAYDRIVTAFACLGRSITAAELDWLLWSRSQSLSGQTTPYHLTETIFY